MNPNPRADGSPADAATVTPFWHRMPWFFLFPLRRSPLLRNLALSAAFGLVVWRAVLGLTNAPAAATLALVLASLAVALLVTGYGFVVIERSAAGYLDPRLYPAHLEQGGVSRPIKMFLVIVLAPAVIALIGGKLLGAVAVVVMMIAFALLIPASAMVITMTDSFKEAINPARCLSTARRIGAPYLLLCLFILMLIVGERQAVQMLMPRSAWLPAAGVRAAADPATQAEMLQRFSQSFALAGFVASFVGNYFVILISALIGYAMFQFSEALGIAVVGPGEARTLGRTTAGEYARRTRDAVIGKLVAAGEIREAIGLLRDDLRERPNDLSLHARLHKLLLHDGASVLIEDHTERYLDLLVNSSNLRPALALVEQAQSRSDHYEPRKLEHVAVLARAALDMSKPEVAARLLRGFDKRHPAHPDVPQIYLLGARLLLQSGRDPAQARPLLQHLIERYPQHAAAQEAKRYLQQFGASDDGGKR